MSAVYNCCCDSWVWSPPVNCADETHRYYRRPPSFPPGHGSSLDRASAQSYLRKICEHHRSFFSKGRILTSKVGNLLIRACSRALTQMILSPSSSQPAQPSLLIGGFQSFFGIKSTLLALRVAQLAMTYNFCDVHRESWHLEWSRWHRKSIHTEHDRSQGEECSGVIKWSDLIEGRMANFFVPTRFTWRYGGSVVSFVPKAPQCTFDNAFDVIKVWWKPYGLAAL